MTKPKVYIAMPCYDTMKVETCVSILNTYAVLARSGITCTFKSVKSSLVTHARNLLTAGFMASDYDYMVCVDADMEFPPEAVLRMLVPEKDIVVTPYRLKENPMEVKYPVEHMDPDNIKILPFDLVELKSAPAGLMLINRSVFKTLMEKYPEKKINFDGLNSIKGIDCNLPGGAFYAFPNVIGTGMNGKEFTKKCLHEAGVAIVPGTSFGKKAIDYVRFSFAASQDNISQALENIKKMLS